MKKILSGNTAAAEAVRLSRVEVVAAYPITPQSEIVETIFGFIADGSLKADFIRVEGEHTAMSAAIGAAMCGARTFTATSSQGVLYMDEMVHWAAGQRVPIVMVLVNRAIGPPWSIWSDHQDAMSKALTGWNILFASNQQDVLDTVIQAYQIAEDPDIHLPLMVCVDGFNLSHKSARVEVSDQAKVDEFLTGKPNVYLDVENPTTLNSLIFPEKSFMEYKYKVRQAQERAKSKIVDVAEKFREKFGRYHGGLINTYKCHDADAVFVSAGTLADQAELAVDKMRENGKKIGSVKIRAYRPFPTEEFKKLAKNIGKFLVFDKNINFGMEGGAMFTDLKAALYDFDGGSRPEIEGVIAGIGGRNVSIDQQCATMDRFLEGKTVEKWIGLHR